jgi:DNA-binding transcriptional LysR family regulator
MQIGYALDMQLTHRQIEVFRAFMASGHVTRAAEALGTSQPTVSRELVRLEQVLGLQLFDRVRGRLQPTARALALLEEVQRSYIGLDRIAATAVSLRQFAQARLSVTCLPALAHALLPDAVRRFVNQQAQAALTLTPQESPQLEQSLTEQRFDMGLIERLVAPPGTQLAPLLQADEVAVLPSGHALLTKRVLKPKDFAQARFISLAPSDPYRQLIDAMFDAHQVPRQLGVEATSSLTVCSLVRQDLGVAIVNPLTALELAGPDLHIRALTVSIPFHVGLVLPALRTVNPLRDAFVVALQAAAADTSARLRRRAIA